MEAIQTELINLAIAVIVACIGFITQKVRVYLQKKEILAKLEANKELVKIVVNAVEQMYKHLNGPERLEIAKKELVELMQAKGIKITEAEINLLIEAAVKEMNDKFKQK